MWNFMNRISFVRKLNIVETVEHSFECLRLFTLLQKVYVSSWFLKSYYSWLLTYNLYIVMTSFTYSNFLLPTESFKLIHFISFFFRCRLSLLFRPMFNTLINWRKWQIKYAEHFKLFKHWKHSLKWFAVISSEEQG